MSPQEQAKSMMGEIEAELGIPMHYQLEFRPNGIINYYIYAARFVYKGVGCRAVVIIEDGKDPEYGLFAKPRQWHGQEYPYGGTEKTAEAVCKTLDETVEMAKANPFSA